MMTFLNRFRHNEDGAVTVDWVVLTALVTGLFAGAFAGIDGGVYTAGESLNTYLSTQAPS